MTRPDFVHAIYIRAEPQAVWDALTSPDATERFWWGERCQANWSVGAAVRFHDDERDIGRPHRGGKARRHSDRVRRNESAAR